MSQITNVKNLAISSINAKWNKITDSDSFLKHIFDDCAFCVDAKHRLSDMGQADEKTGDFCKQCLAPKEMCSHDNNCAIIELRRVQGQLIFDDKLREFKEKLTTLKTQGKL